MDTTVFSTEPDRLVIRCGECRQEFTSVNANLEHMENCTYDSGSDSDDDENYLEKYEDKLFACKKQFDSVKNHYMIKHLRIIRRTHPLAKNIEDCLQFSNITDKMKKKCDRMAFNQMVSYLVKKLCYSDNAELRPHHRLHDSSDDYVVKRGGKWIIDMNGNIINRLISELIITYNQRKYDLILRATTYKKQEQEQQEEQQEHIRKLLLTEFNNNKIKVIDGSSDDYLLFTY